MKDAAAFRTKTVTKGTGVETGELEGDPKDFPSGLMVMTHASSAGGVGSIPGVGTKLPPTKEKAM